MDTVAALRRQERIIAIVRWGAVLFAALLVTLYEAPRPELEAVAEAARGRAYALATALAAVGLLVELVLRVTHDADQLRRFGLAVLVADTVITLGFVWVFAFDRFSAQWALLTILPLEGAMRFQARGALGVWAAIVPAYLLRDVYAARLYQVPLDEGTVAYRLGLLFVIALFAGVSARELELQRRILTRLAASQQRLAAALEPAEILPILCQETVACLDARAAVVYVHDGSWFQPVAAWPAEELPRVMTQERSEVAGELDGPRWLPADQSHPARLSIPLRWRRHPQHVLVVRTGKRRGDRLWMEIASSLAESAAVALATTDVLTAEQRAGRRLRYLEALRSRFVATIAHDLRSPLTIFKGVSALLRGRRDDITRGQIDEMLRSVDRQASRLNRLADDLLDGARLEADKLALQPMPCDLRSVIAGILDDIEEEVAVAADGDLRIVADPARLDRVLWNLLSNAEKYGRPPFELRAWRDPDGETVHLTVRDHGPGLDPQQRARLFEEFVTSDGAAGVGLGLAIVWQLVSAHGGTVRYEDATPGACFVVSLPAHGPRPLGVQ